MPPADPPVRDQATVTGEPDFNRDGFADLAVGGSWKPLTGDMSAGVVNILYGSSTGLSKAPAQTIAEGDFSSSSDNSFGYPLTTGDFDGDGFTDLAVGNHAAQVGNVPEAGTVRVIYGSKQGLSNKRSQLWSQASPGIAGTPEAEDSFGDRVDRRELWPGSSRRSRDRCAV